MVTDTHTNLLLSSSGLSDMDCVHVWAGMVWVAWCGRGVGGHGVGGHGVGGRGVSGCVTVLL